MLYTVSWNNLGNIGVGLGLLIGLISIGVCIYFGLRGQREGIVQELRGIKDKIIEGFGELKDKLASIDSKVENVFTYVQAKLESGTVERHLPNLGKVKVSAQPGTKNTTYRIAVEKPIIMSNLMTRISKESGFTEKEIEMFDELPAIIASSSEFILVRVPSTESKVCTDYISLLLKWMDEVYSTKYKAYLESFEEPILKEK